MRTWRKCVGEGGTMVGLSEGDACFDQSGVLLLIILPPD